eukprot:15481098-Alexandrium_andersonii.AAC.1
MFCATVRGRCQTPPQLLPSLLHPADLEDAALRRASEGQLPVAALHPLGRARARAMLYALGAAL